MKVKVLSMLFMFVSLVSCVKKQADGVKVVDTTAYENALKQPDAQLLDVRTADEYSEGHIANAKNVNIMADDFDAQVATLDKTKPVLVYCKVGGRSAKAATRLKELGFTNIIDLDGGFNSWSNDNKPIEK